MAMILKTQKDLTIAVFIGYVGFPPQRPSPDGGGAEGEFVIR